MPQRASPESSGIKAVPDHPLADILLGGGLIAFFALAIGLSWNWPLSARLMPQAMGVMGIFFAGVQTCRSALLMSKAKSTEARLTIGLPDDAPAAARVLIAFLAYLLLVYAVGFVYATAVFIIAYLLRFSGLRRTGAIAVGLLGAAFVYFLFSRLLALPFDDGFMVDMISPWIESSII